MLIFYRQTISHEFHRCDAILMKIRRNFTIFLENVEGLGERAYALHKQKKVAYAPPNAQFAVRQGRLLAKNI